MRLATVTAEMADQVVSPVGGDNGQYIVNEEKGGIKETLRERGEEKTHR
jgi:hypothetical protein